MRQLSILIILTFTASFAKSQSLLSLDQLEKRLQSGRDTVYIINFWATWCAPCVKEIPSFEKFNKEHGLSEKVKVLLVSVDFISDRKIKVIPFVKKKQLKSEVFVLNEPDQQKYIDRIDKNWSGTIPATLFVKGKKRKFVESEFSYLALEKELQNFK
ncbi:MAG: TlpA family protein disulfide reductase [Chitinophagaceae bacterium]|nr:TlpA family protein disulfide reductase [Chitinophagaceae bacterium]